MIAQQTSAFGKLADVKVVLCDASVRLRCAAVEREDHARVCLALLEVLQPGIKCLLQLGVDNDLHLGHRSAVLQHAEDLRLGHTEVEIKIIIIIAQKLISLNRDNVEHVPFLAISRGTGLIAARLPNEIFFSFHPLPSLQFPANKPEASGEQERIR